MINDLGSSSEAPLRMAVSKVSRKVSSISCTPSRETNSTRARVKQNAVHICAKWRLRSGRCRSTRRLNPLSAISCRCSAKRMKSGVYHHFHHNHFVLSRKPFCLSPARGGFYRSRRTSGDTCNLFDALVFHVEERDAGAFHFLQCGQGTVNVHVLSHVLLQCAALSVHSVRIQIVRFFPAANIIIKTL